MGAASPLALASDLAAAGSGGFGSGARAKALRLYHHVDEPPARRTEKLCVPDSRTDSTVPTSPSLSGPPAASPQVL
jgi:hypothetical protein